MLFPLKKKRMVASFEESGSSWNLSLALSSYENNATKIVVASVFIRRKKVSVIWTEVHISFLDFFSWSNK